MPGSISPIYEYAHGDGSCAVTGGYVYRGERIPDLAGAYIFGDYCRGVLEAFLPRDGRATQARALGPRSMHSHRSDRMRGASSMCCPWRGRSSRSRPVRGARGIPGVAAG
ncbi:MAG TPA: hypothetical protein VKB32_09575 [Actinomycetota bacterium]|nr:hypothetical protein [Actinomycetota bacterium]